MCLSDYFINYYNVRRYNNNVKVGLKDQLGNCIYKRKINNIIIHNKI